MVEMWMGMPCELVSCIVFIFDFLFSIFFIMLNQISFNPLWFDCISFHFNKN
jgi:hypothetical protein